MKLDIIFAGAARDEQQEGLLLDLLAPLGIDKHTVTEAKSDREKTMEGALVAALRHHDVVLDWRLRQQPDGFHNIFAVRRTGASGGDLSHGTGAR